MQLLIASALAHRGFDMGEIAELKPLAERTISATLGKKIEADEYLTLNYNLSAYHEIALTRAFGSGLALAVTPRGSIKVWIVNNLLCAFLMWALLHEYAPGHPSLMPQAACVFVMFANCLLDLALAREMYSRRAKDLRQAVGKF
jgi:hypothetical protein